MKDAEIEIQVQIEDETPLRNFLKTSGRYVGELRQVDEYFTPPHKDFLAERPVSEWLRLRDENGKAKVTYKFVHFKESGESHFRDEYETAVSDIQTLRSIFQALGFRSIVTVDKERQVYVYKDYEVVFDEVVGLGKFTEVEYKGESSVDDPQRVTDEMIAFLKEVGCVTMKRNYQGYPFLLLFPKEAVFEVVT
ncbi:MAG: class IV adenylate cyclase [Patescibacteria group bacterium]|jgi:adenylate cyclase class 2